MMGHSIMAEPKRSPVDLARLAALRGDVDTALPVLVAVAETGDAAAAASAAELLAFLNRWHEVLPLAGRFIADPFSVYAGNVFDDMVRLLGRAARETGAWDNADVLADAAQRKVDADLTANAFGFPDAKVDSVRRRLLGILDRLRQHIALAGRDPSTELIEIWGIETPPPDRAAYDAAILVKRNASPDRRFALATAFRIDAEIVRLHTELTQPIAFPAVIAIAEALIRQGHESRVWDLIVERWPGWSPIDRAQVAPCGLLTNPMLAGFVTSKRAERLVRMPRACHTTD